MEDPRESRSSTVLITALSSPAALHEASVESLLPGLAGGFLAEGELARGALAAVVLARPELVDAGAIDALLRGLDGDASGSRSATAILAALVASSEASAGLASDAIWRPFELPAAPGSRELQPTRHELLLQLALSAPEHVSLDRVLAVASGLETVERERCLGEIVEPLLLDRGGAIATSGAAELDRLRTAFSSTRHWRYSVGAVAQHPRAGEPWRAAAEVAATELFVHRANAREILARKPFRFLIVHNVRVGQGDELIRIGPLLQALLASNPELELTMVTGRPYLYEHPRIAAVSIHDEAATAAALDAPFDGLYDVFEPLAPDVNLSLAAGEHLARRVAERAPALHLRSDVGFGHFIYQRIAFDDGVDRTDAMELRKRTVQSVYACSKQLLLELGLPWFPVARSRGAGGAADPFTGSPSDDATMLWESLRGDGSRPVALVSPFGGNNETKGFPRDQMDVLARELADLVSEGFRVVVLPPGERWADAEVMARLYALVPASARPHVVVAPDPAAPAADAATLGLRERPDLRHADRVMRLFKHFVPRADLVITIEGWLGHLAAQLGRPLRIVLMTGSFSVDWYPPGENVQLMEALSSLSRPTCVGVLADDSPPPLPRRSKKELLVVALRALRHAPVDAAEPLARRALASLDHDLRAAALRGLASGVERPSILATIQSFLTDPEPAVRCAASEVLLEAARLGIPIGVKPSLLRAHRLITFQAWDAIVAMGADALPALAVAANGENAVIRREAPWAIQRILGLRVPFQLAINRARREAAQSED